MCWLEARLHHCRHSWKPELCAQAVARRRRQHPPRSASTPRTPSPCSAAQPHSPARPPVPPHNPAEAQEESERAPGRQAATAAAAAAVAGRSLDRSGDPGGLLALIALRYRPSCCSRKPRLSRRRRSGVSEAEMRESRSFMSAGHDREVSRAARLAAELPMSAMGWPGGPGSSRAQQQPLLALDQSGDRCRPAPCRNKDRLGCNRGRRAGGHTQASRQAVPACRQPWSRSHNASEEARAPRRRSSAGLCLKVRCAACTRRQPAHRCDGSRRWQQARRSGVSPQPPATAAAARARPPPVAARCAAPGAAPCSHACRASSSQLTSPRHHSACRRRSKRKQPWRLPRRRRSRTWRRACSSPA